MSRAGGQGGKVETGDSINQLLVLILAFLNVSFLVLPQRQTGLPSNQSSRT